MRTIITLTLAALLTACGSTATTLHYGDEKNPNRVTSVTGLKSHDAANTITYGAYTESQIKKPQKAVCSLKARDGQTLNITGLAEFTCWAPETDQTARPVQAEGEAMQIARAVREGVGGTIKDATPALLGAAALEASKDGNRRSVEQAQISAETERARDAAGAASQSQLVEALREKPQVIFAAPLPVPEAAASTTPTTTTP
jgi:hypothetical protein